MLRSRVVMGIAVTTAVAAGAVGGAVIGVPMVSGAQPFPRTATPATADGTTSPAGRPMRDAPVLDAAAKALNLTTDQLRTKLSDGKTTIADVAKEQHVDINTVIDAMTKVAKDRITDIVNQPWPHGGRGPGGAGPAGVPGVPGAVPGKGPLGRLGAMALDPVAKALGISTDELKTDLAKGESIADIAKAKNVDLNKVIDTLVGD